jgi:hypothetical protein
MSQSPKPFPAALAELGLSASGLKLENFRTDGTSNYVGNLNFQGQTWSAVLRMPAKGATVEEFLSDKVQALAVSDYLGRILRQSIEVGFDCVLAFDGQSCLSQNDSTQAFLRQQAQDPALRLTDAVNNRQKLLQGMVYPDGLEDQAVKEYIATYDGPFYVSRGAPASETLEDFPHLAEPAAHAVAALHRATGQGQPIELAASQAVLSQLEPLMALQARQWQPSADSKEGRGLAKSLSAWNPQNDTERAELITAERFLRSQTGRDFYRQTVESLLQPDLLPAHPLMAFGHGDLHGGNLIFVEYEYRLNQPEILLDRVFVNQLFVMQPALSEVGIAMPDRQTIHISQEPEPTIRAKRDHYYEIHLIDLDSGHGTTNEDKALHLFDALFFAMSAAHLTTLFAEEITASSILEWYYQGLTKL